MDFGIQIFKNLVRAVFEHFSSEKILKIVKTLITLRRLHIILNIMIYISMIVESVEVPDGGTCSIFLSVHKLMPYRAGFKWLSVY